MRCFLGLDLSAPDKLAIQTWRERALPAFPHPVPAVNFHVTSVFLGNLQQRQLEALCNEIDTLSFSALSVTFDQLGYWSKPKILWLGCSHPPATIMNLTGMLTRAANTCRITLQERKYVPHITLVRNNAHPPPAAASEPEFTLRFRQLHLFESVSGKGGVRYLSRFSWPLR